MNKESHVYLVRMEKVKDEAEREMTDLWHMLHETAQIESTVNENSKETRLSFSTFLLLVFSHSTQ